MTRADSVKKYFMSYKALYDILCSVKRHMISRVIFRWENGQNVYVFCQQKIVLLRHATRHLPGVTQPCPQGWAKNVRQKEQLPCGFLDCTFPRVSEPSDGEESEHTA